MRYRPRIAVYHNLAEGGALVAARALMLQTTEQFDYDLYSPRARGGARRIARSESKAMELIRSEQHQRVAAKQINRRSYDLVLVHPSQLTQAPNIIRHLDTRSLYFVQEPRRRTFEAGYNQPVDAHGGGRNLVRRAARRAFEAWVRPQDRRATLTADHLLCNSYFCMESIRRSYGRDAHVLHLGVDTDVFLPARAAVSSGRQGAVLSVGGLEPAKRHDFVLQALALVPQGERPRLDVVFQRELPGQRRLLEETARRLSVDIRLHCNVDEGTLVRLYQAAEATFCVAVLEPFGLTALESMSCGTPVIAVREGGYRETVRDGINGLFVHRSPSSAADALNALRSGVLGSREDLRSSILDYWSWSRSGERFAKHVEHLLGGATSSERSSGTGRALVSCGS